MDITTERQWPRQDEWARYYLEYLEPVSGPRHWAFGTHQFLAPSDEAAAAQVVPFVAVRGLEEERADIRYPQLRCCINQRTGRQIPLPWDAVHALPKVTLDERLAAD